MANRSVHRIESRRMEMESTQGTKLRGQDDEAAGIGRGAREDEILREFLAVSARLSEVISRLLEEARREGADITCHTGVDREIRELKKSNESILKLVRLLEALKRMQ